MAIIIVALFAAYVVTLLYYILFPNRYRRSQLPPGPKSLPIVGNLFNLPKVQPWVVYRDWSQQYASDLLFLDLPRQPTVLLNTFTAAVDLMEKRSRIYSDKPVSVMDELTGWDWNFALMPYGQRWRDTRRTFHQYFNQRAVEAYRPIMVRGVYAFLHRASASTEDISIECISQAFASIILDITFGMQVQDDDELISLSRTAVECLVEGKVEGRFWIEYFPWLRYVPPWIPGSSARKYGRRYKPIVMATRDQPFDAVLEATMNNTVTSSVAQRLINKLQALPVGTDEYKRQEKIARDAAGIAYAAAVDTQTSALSSFFLAMIRCPHIQEQAQQDLQSVVGFERLPVVEDLAALPYIEAIVLETLRWIPVVPLGLPHRVMVDDEYSGYLIPRGSTIIPNVWAMLHNPVDYPDPETFNPDRFMLDGKLNKNVPDPIAAFGFGRRICPGRYLAKEILGLIVASVLHAFVIESTTLGDREKINANATTGLLSFPESLSCRLKPRNARLVELINADT